ncbi:PTS sugar transporter subunit IIB [candidate division FCPU426 bacterium]|nr:PTS sugar transporter subunit IIB [candidate division FCPU426 bacterium]
MAVDFVLVRIDDRLIHGQVAVGWVKAVSPTMLMVANDAVVKDPLQKSLMEMAAAPSLKVKICGVREAAELCAEKELQTGRIMLLFSSPEDTLRAVEAGLPLKKLNVGGMRYSPGKRQIMKAIAISQEDSAYFKALLARGIRVTIQMVPTDEPVNIGKYL